MTQAEEYAEKFKGRFVGILRWKQLDELWATLNRDAGKGWHIYAVGEEPPSNTVTAEEMQTFIEKVDHLLREEHEEDYCGIVYADDPQAPSFVKIFDPNNLGVSCGFSDNPPLPGWVLSKIPPIDLPEAFPPPGNRRRWWQKLFS
jgi:hypothetical protein